LYADQHDWVHAEQALQVAVEMDSATAVSQLNLADIYRAQGKEDNARTLLQQTIQLHPESALAQHALGLSLIRARQTEKALSHLRKATQLEPENAHFAYVYILALESSHPVQALTAWRLAVKQHPGDPELMSVCRGLNCSQVDQN
jgi:Flp pilus assembly protein TadD